MTTTSVSSPRRTLTRQIFSAGAYLSASAGLASLTCTMWAARRVAIHFSDDPAPICSSSAASPSCGTSPTRTCVTVSRRRADFAQRSLLIKELVFGFEALALLVAAIVCSVFVGRSATVTSPTIPQATILLLLKAAGKSLAYADVPAIVGFTCVTSLLCVLTVQGLRLARLAVHDDHDGASRARRASLAQSAPRARRRHHHRQPALLVGRGEERLQPPRVIATSFSPADLPPSVHLCTCRAA